MARGDRSVDVFVRKLRSKIQKRSPEWAYIHTHFGIGYRFEPESLAGGEVPAAEGQPEPGAAPAESVLAGGSTT
jgi:DNA-binding winged helix-turn-helix (wHTH) protein